MPRGFKRQFGGQEPGCRWLGPLRGCSPESPRAGCCPGLDGEGELARALEVLVFLVALDLRPRLLADIGRKPSLGARGNDEHVFSTWPRLLPVPAKGLQRAPGTSQSVFSLLCDVSRRGHPSTLARFCQTGQRAYTGTDTRKKGHWGHGKSVCHTHLSEAGWASLP